LVGVAAGLSNADDTGRRYLIGVAAAVQLAIFPVWLGGAMGDRFAAHGHCGIASGVLLDQPRNHHAVCGRRVRRSSPAPGQRLAGTAKHAQGLGWRAYELRSYLGIPVMFLHHFVDVAPGRRCISPPAKRLRNPPWPWANRQISCRTSDRLVARFAPTSVSGTGLARDLLA
jgi:hypothetical protein